MGNICGKIEDSEAAPGRPIAAKPQSFRAAKGPRVGGPAHTLGGSSSSPGPNAVGDDARQRAVEAAESRARAAGKGGKLQAQLSAQKKQQRSETLAEASLQEIRARNADAVAAEAREWD